MLSDFSSHLVNRTCDPLALSGPQVRGGRAEKQDAQRLKEHLRKKLAFPPALVFAKAAPLRTHVYTHMQAWASL